MQTKISESWLQTRIAISFWYTIFVRTYIHNSKTTGCIRTFYLSNNCSTIGDDFSRLELYARYDWRVMTSNMHHSLFLICHLCVLLHITWKLQVVCGHSAYQMTALLPNTFLVCFRVAWETRLAKYSPWHASWSFSDTTLSRVHCKSMHT